MAGHSRLEDLRRRVRKDPASIVFGAFAEELRRLGLIDEAIDTCRAGLLRHPGYASARVTLAMALAQRGEHAPAAAEFRQVLELAPENLVARKGLAEALRAEGDPAAALDELKRVLPFSPSDQELGRSIDAPSDATCSREHHATDAAQAAVTEVRDDMDARIDRQLHALEQLLAAIQRARLASAHG